MRGRGRYTAVPMPNVSVKRCRLSRIQPLRALFLQELNAQCRYDAAHWRKGTNHYMVQHDGRAVGYGAVKDMHESRGTMFELYLVPQHRDEAPVLLREAIGVSGAEALECQSNDRFYTSLVRQFAREPTSDTILFAAGPSNGLPSPGAVVRRRHRRDRVFEHTVEPVGNFVVDVGGDVVGTGASCSTTTRRSPISSWRCAPTCGAAATGPS